MVGTVGAGCISGAAYLGAYRKDVSVAAVFPGPSSRGAALATERYAAERGPGRAKVLCFCAGGIGTIFVIAAPQNLFAQQAGSMVEMLKSFSFTGEKAAAPAAPAAGAANVRYTRFQDPREAAFTVEVPAGESKAACSAVPRSTRAPRSMPLLPMAVPSSNSAIGAWSPSPSRTRCSPWPGSAKAEPIRPATATCGSSAAGLPGPAFAQEYAAKFARDTQSSGLRLENVKPLREYDKTRNLGADYFRTTAGEAGFTCVRNGRGSAGKVVAATTAAVMSNSGMGALWYASFLASFVAPAGQAGEAEAIGRHIIETFQMSPQWEAEQSHLTMQTAQIAHEAYEHTNKIITSTFEHQRRTVERTNRNFDDTIRGVVRLRNPNTGGCLGEGLSGGSGGWLAAHRGRESVCLSCRGRCASPCAAEAGAWKRPKPATLPVRVSDCTSGATTAASW